MLFIPGNPSESNLWEEFVAPNLKSYTFVKVDPGFCNRAELQQFMVENNVKIIVTSGMHIELLRELRKYTNSKLIIGYYSDFLGKALGEDTPNETHLDFCTPFLVRLLNDTLGKMLSY